MNFKELSEKKVLNIPVIYWAGVFVLILAVVAWRMKSSTPDVAQDDSAVKDSEEPDYSKVAGTGTGTVTVVQTPVDTDASAATNAKWEKDAIGFLMKNKVSAVEAQKAVTHFLNGEDLSFEEKGWIDSAVIGVGLPPEGTSGVGVIGSEPGKKQFSNFPGTHTVKNSNDDTPGKIAQIYYGNADANHVNLIISKNVNKGPAGTTYSPGTVISVPKWEDPKYYVTVNESRFSTVASKNGVLRASVVALNPGVTEPFKKKGLRLRVG